MRLTLPPTAAVLVLVGLLAFGIPGGHSAGAPAVPMPLARASTLLPVLAHAAPRAPPGASGSGTFFQNTVLPLPASGSETCTRGPGASGACLNVTNEPSLNLTSRGLLAVAYTALTNQTPCANVSDNASTEIGFSVSRDLGTSWSAPRYLGNSQCALAAQYPSAWEPSLTSLANGTLVLAYLQYNLTYLGPYAFTSFSYGYAPNAYPSNTPTSRLVVTESYDNGTTWTSPTVLNSSTLGPGQLTSWAPERPWVDAFGDTVYVVWENATQTDLAPQQFYPTFTTAGSLQSHLKVSQDGGRTWGATIDLPVTPGSYQYPYAPEHVG
ncbi:MAG TPA: sialidase family protein, partial [Thermoplasmata archaeon]|nr:sialidase family protein [Thermoplasmata archaeon]